MKLVIGFVLALFTSSASAVSFDCAKASTFAERTICTDTYLMKLDDALSNNYKGMLGADFGGPVAGLKADQREWIKSRNSCTTRQCLIDAYKKRIDETCEYGVVSGVHPVCTSADDVEGSPKAEAPSPERPPAALLSQPVALAVSSSIQPQTYTKWKDKAGRVITCTESVARCMSKVMDDADIGAVLRVTAEGRQLSYGGAANIVIADTSVTDDELLNNPQKAIDNSVAQDDAQAPIEKIKGCLRALKVGMTESDAMRCGKPTHQVHESDGSATLTYLFGYYGTEGFELVLHNSKIGSIKAFN